MNMKWLLTGSTALVLIATPVLAANDAINSGVKKENTNKPILDDAANPASKAAFKNSQEQSSDGADSSAQNDRSQNNSQRNSRAMTQEKMRTALKDAGFTQIRVLDAQYLVQAKDNDGNTVYMAIKPPSSDNRNADSGGNQNADRSDLNNDASDDERSDSTRRSMNYSDGNDGRNRGARGWRNSSANIYNRAFDEGFREGYRRGSDNSTNGRGYDD